jgi:hypothetical protein
VRGSPLQLRQFVARSLRHVVAGSLVFSAAAVFVAAWATFAIEIIPTPVAAVTLSRAIVTAGQPLSLAEGGRPSATVTVSAVEVVEPAPSSVAELVAMTVFEVAAERRTNSSAISSVSNDEALEIESALVTSARQDEVLTALITRAATRDKSAPFVEPMRGLTRAPTLVEDHASIVARAASRDELKPFVEPMRGLGRLPTLAEENASVVARAALRLDAPAIIEAAYPIDAEILQTPMLQPGDIVEATISFYYCVQGETLESGDGGAFCGAMRDGTVVYDGAAACAWTYLGQRFIIVGDPIERIYTCADTGSAVHGLHRDIWFNSAAEGWVWQLSTGTKGLLLIVN